MWSSSPSLSPVLHPQLLHAAGHLLVLLEHLPSQPLVNFGVLLDNLRNRLERWIRLDLLRRRRSAPITRPNPIPVQSILYASGGTLLLLWTTTLLFAPVDVLVRFAAGSVPVKVVLVVGAGPTAMVVWWLLVMGMLLLLVVAARASLELELWFRRLARANPTTAPNGGSRN